MWAIIALHHELMFVLIVVFGLVAYILARVIWAFRADSYYPLFLVRNTWLELGWTLIPAFVLIGLALPTFALLYGLDDVLEPAITVKVVGHQWYWVYEYGDYGDCGYESYLRVDSALGDLRLLEVDMPLVLPAFVHIRLIVVSGDVLHSFAVPALGLKCDAVPGRLNQLALFILRDGLFYGQCSEICGIQHGFMPIVVESVGLEAYLNWVGLLENC